MKDFFKIKYYIKTLDGAIKKRISRRELCIDYDNSIIFMLACDYNNMGDILIRLSQQRFIEQYTKDKEIVIVNLYDTYKYLKDIKKNATKKTLFVLTGGGNTNEKYSDIERARNCIIKSLRNNGCKIIGFPQTLDYSNTNRGDYYLKKAQIAYQSNRNFIFFAREKESYTNAVKLFSNTMVNLAPDIALSHKTIKGSNERDGIGLLMRNDEEKRVNESFLRNLLKKLKLIDVIYDNDMTVKHFEEKKIYDYLEEKVNFVLKRRMIITDRLHGMILCYITNTPCIVFPNANHKIIETFDNWLQDKQNFIIMEKNESIDDVLDDINGLLKLGKLKKRLFTIEYSELANLLNMQDYVNE